MKKLLCSILVGLAALSVTGCDDDEVKTPDFAVSTAQWTFSQQEGMQRMIVSAPGAWTLTGIPDWMTVTPAEAAGPCEITMTYTTNETGAPRKATLTVTCGNETRTIGVEQETVVPESAAGNRPPRPVTRKNVTNSYCCDIFLCLPRSFAPLK